MPSPLLPTAARTLSIGLLLVACGGETGPTGDRDAETPVARNEESPGAGLPRPTGADESSTAPSTNRVKILVPTELTAHTAGLEARYGSLDLVPYADVPDLVRQVSDADAVVGWTITNNAMRRGERLRWVHVYTGGVNEFLDLPRLGPDSDVVLTSMKIQKGPEVADHAMALLLSLTRNLPQSIRRQDDRRWENRSDLPIVELRGKTMLIVGMGGIGTQLAERAHAHGMTVLGTDAKDLPFMSSVEYVGRPDELLSLLPRADVVAICAPLTPHTEGLIDAEAFAAMRQGAYLVAVSRGEIVDTDALVEALRSGKILAAGLDVVDPEPLPRDHPLWGMENVVITPHHAGLSDGRVERQTALALENIDRFMRGLPLKNAVDKGRGF